MKAARRAGERGRTVKESYRHAMKVDRRGRDSPFTLQEYERLANLGTHRVQEALLARHNQRMEAIAKVPDLFVGLLYDPLVPLVAFDHLLPKYGASPQRIPVDFSGEWPDHLAWAVDSAVATIRLAHAGQFVGAATIARNQLERWTMHRAFNHGFSKNQGEAMIDFIARVWSTSEFGSLPPRPEPSDLFEEDDLPVPTDEPELDHNHVFLSDGTEICPAVLYGFLSETMHANECRESNEWALHDLLDADRIPEEVGFPCGVLADTISLCFQQIKAAIETLASEAQDNRTRLYIRSLGDRFSDPDPDLDLDGEVDLTKADPSVNQTKAIVAKGAERQSVKAQADEQSPAFTRPPFVSLFPLSPGQGLSEYALQVLAEAVHIYEELRKGNRPAGRLYRDDELTAIAFTKHRAASADAALRAMEAEREAMGDFDEDNLLHRETAWTVTIELCTLASLAIDDPNARAAANLVATGLRSAYWLWLEDDDRAMAVLRCVLEQAARLRMYRLKPESAAKLEASENTMPRDWIEKSGWKRLRILNTALGEFAHTSARSRWVGARRVLSDLRIDVPDENAIYTARGATIDLMHCLVAREVIETLKAKSEILGAAAGEIFTRYGFVPDGDTSLDSILTHIWTQKDLSLGEPIFTPNPDGPGVR